MLNKFLLKFKKVFQGKNSGNFKSVLTGSGIEFSDTRKYNYGDDYRSINWKQTAKHGDFFVNLYQKDTDVDLHVFFDFNQNRNAGIDQLNSDLVKNFLTELAIFYQQKSINLTGFFFSSGLKIINLKKDLTNIYKFIESWKDILQNQKSEYISHLGEFLDYQKKLSKRHSIIIFSDFLDVSDEQSQAIKFLEEKNEVFVFQIPMSDFEGMNYNGFTLN